MKLCIWLVFLSYFSFDATLSVSGYVFQTGSSGGGGTTGDDDDDDDDDDNGIVELNPPVPAEGCDGSWSYKSNENDLLAQSGRELSNPQATIYTQGISILDTEISFERMFLVYMGKEGTGDADLYAQYIDPDTGCRIADWDGDGITDVENPEGLKVPGSKLPEGADGRYFSIFSINSGKSDGTAFIYYLMCKKNLLTGTKNYDIVVRGLNEKGFPDNKKFVIDDVLDPGIAGFSAPNAALKFDGTSNLLFLVYSSTSQSSSKINAAVINLDKNKDDQDAVKILTVVDTAGLAVRPQLRFFHPTVVFGALKYLALITYMENNNLFARSVSLNIDNGTVTNNWEKLIAEGVRFPLGYDTYTLGLRATFAGSAGAVIAYETTDNELEFKVLHEDGTISAKPVTVEEDIAVNSSPQLMLDPEPADSSTKFLLILLYRFGDSIKAKKYLVDYGEDPPAIAEDQNFDPTISNTAIEDVLALGAHRTDKHISIFWTNNEGGGKTATYAKKMSFKGNTIWGPNLVTDAGQGDKSLPFPVFLEDNQLLLWSDSRDQSPDIYGALFSDKGNYGGDIPPPSNKSAPQFEFIDRPLVRLELGYDKAIIDTIAHFEVQRGTNKQQVTGSLQIDWETIGKTAGNETTFFDEAPEENMEYFYRARAVRNTGANEVFSGYGFTSGKLSTPRIFPPFLRAIKQAGEEIELEIVNFSQVATGILLQYKLEDFTFEDLVNDQTVIPGNFLHAGLNEGTVYEYRARLLEETVNPDNPNKSEFFELVASTTGSGLSQSPGDDDEGNFFSPTGGSNDDDLDLSSPGAGSGGGGGASACAGSVEAVRYENSFLWVILCLTVLVCLVNLGRRT